MRTKISARDVRMDYAARGASERVRVLEGLSLDVREGEFLSVLGLRAAANPPSSASWPG